MIARASLSALVLVCLSCGSPGQAVAPRVEVGAADQIYVPAGDFEMGLDEAHLGVSRELCDTDRKICPWSMFNDETPSRKLKLSAFYIDKFETTVGEYRKCVDASACEAPVSSTYCTWTLPEAEDHPINCISWHQAKSYCEWAGKRLPTEAEWERAARGSDGRIFPWGDRHPSMIRANVGNFSGPAEHEENRSWGAVNDYDDGFLGTAPVGSFEAGLSPVGAADMAGNVSEWVEDQFNGGYDETDLEDPLGDNGVGRVARGGSFAVDSVEIRTTARRVGAPIAPYNILGVRCARSATQ